MTLRHRGFFAGLEAAAVLSLVMALGRMAGLGVNLELALGALVTGAEGLGTWMLGFALHLTLGGLLGEVYALLLARVLRRSDPHAGLYLGLVHAMVAGLLLGALGGPLAPLPEVPPMGPFFAALGAPGVAYFILLHALFGVTLAAVLFRRLAGVPRPAAVSAGPR